MGSIRVANIRLRAGPGYSAIIPVDSLIKLPLAPLVTSDPISLLGISYDRIRRSLRRD
jgi:hypothetical protein